MSEEIRVNRPAPQVRQDGVMEKQEKPSSKLPWIVLLVVVVAIVVLGVLFRDKLFASKAKVSKGYQAVFLTNGQVYFGKIQSTKMDTVTLTDIFYLQVIQQQPLQGTPQEQAAGQQTISLVKLGEELHGPVDEMHINRSQILFYEDLKEDGKVVKAIKDYKANPSK